MQDGSVTPIGSFFRNKWVRLQSHALRKSISLTIAIILIINALLFALSGIIWNNVLVAAKSSGQQLTEGQLEEFAQNNILFYDPSENDCKTDKKCGPPAGNQITWIGDSYSTGAQKIIEEKFSGISFGDSVNDADSTIQACKYVGVDTECNANPTNPSGLDILQRVIDAGELKPYLVFALGTNGGWESNSTDKLEYVNKFKEIIAAEPDTKVIFVNSKTPKNDYKSSNAVLEDLVNSSNNYYLADWVSAYNADYFADDPEKIHPSANGGYEKWVGAIYTALSSAGGNCTVGEFVWYGQFVEPWSSIEAIVTDSAGNVHNTTLGVIACGPTAFAMLANMLLSEEITPEDTLKVAIDTGSIVWEGSIGTELTKNLSEYYGLEYEKLDNSSTEASMSDISQHLKDGWMIMTGGAGSIPYTSGGHYVGIRGITDDGKWLIADPGHAEEYSQQSWEPMDVMNAGMNIDNVYAIHTSSNGSSSSSSSSSSGATTGDNKNYAGEEVWTEGELEKIEENKSVYQTTANEYNIPWQIIAVMHSLETGLSRENPSNGQGLYQLYSYTNGGTNSNAFLPAGEVSESEFQRQTNLAAEEMIGIVESANLDLNTDDGVKYLLFAYNGVAQTYIDKALCLGFDQHGADIGEGSPYVMNKYDAQRDPDSPNMSSCWPGRYVADGVYDSSATQWGPGGYVKYIALGGGTGSSDYCPGPTGEQSDVPIEPINDPSDNIACDPRTTDLGVRDDAYYNGEKYSIRLCSIPNIKDLDSAFKKSMDPKHEDDGYIHVNSRVSGAFFALSEEHKNKCGNHLEATEGFRTEAMQAYYWNCYQTGSCNGGNLAAAVGYSNHQGGLAIDFNTGSYCTTDSDVASGGAFNLEFLKKFGLEDGRYFSQTEYWHVDPIGD